MSWGERRKFTFIAIFFLLVVVILGVLLIDFKPPSCTDGKRNQEEEGIDCGGPCTTVCSFSVSDLSVEWSRSFKVKDGIYNSVAYVKNPNLNMRGSSVPYIFKLYDNENILIYERKGKIDILPEPVVPVFEATINTGNRIPKRTTFELPLNFEWERDISPKLEIKTKNLKIEELDNSSLRIKADILNQSLNDIRDLKLVIVVFGKEGNVLNSSRTVIDKLSKDLEKEVSFTWPNLSEEDIVRIEILPAEYRILEL